MGLKAREEEGGGRVGEVARRKVSLGSEGSSRIACTMCIKKL